MPRAANRPWIGTSIVPAFRGVDRYHPRPDQTSHSGAIHQSAWTYILTDSLTHKHHPPNYFQPTHQRKSSFIERPMLTHRPIQNHYDFELEAGIAKHCLGVKIVDIAMIKSKKNLLSGERCLTRLHVRTCTMHPNTLCRSPSKCCRGT